MPNTPSAKKELRKSSKLRARNRQQRSSLRTAIKKVRTAVESSNLDEAQSAFQLATKKLDQAAAKDLIHKNTASRTKSRLAKLISSKSQTASS